MALGRAGNELGKRHKALINKGCVALGQTTNQVVGGLDDHFGRQFTLIVMSRKHPRRL